MAQLVAMQIRRDFVEDFVGALSIDPQLFADGSLGAFTLWPGVPRIEEVVLLPERLAVMGLDVRLKQPFGPRQNGEGPHLRTLAENGDRGLPSFQMQVIESDRERFIKSEAAVVDHECARTDNSRMHGISMP